jgi:hypothetical protein
MKFVLQLLTIFSTCLSFSQIGIETISPATAALIDFPVVNNKRGLILPLVDNLPTGAAATNGTLLFHDDDSRVKARINGLWVNLTKNAGSTTGTVTNASPESTNGIIIGATSSAAEGVLVLESSSKALVLPKIDNAHTTVINPYPGMMCYDPTNKVVSIFNGTHWYFLR